ncbi:putative membrane protein [Chryseobacterium ginsenosidimutans]|uniref:chryseobasin maturation helper ChrI n=1 Tax=Chryseobacterium ginsenosidimutans TaxID=687846 RepID=UPI00216743FC|nr:anthrone oxygenase family protein [Chryseobacterium ginsenosidimutans]MCS3869633.1 putative membrane protein [Chryseobacterium ginsenosidimutans]
MTTLLLIVTATLTALIAGLFYAYSCSVVLGLGKLSDTEYLKSMQSINREILNPVFFMSFMGTAFLLPISTFIYRGQHPVFLLLLLATLAYLLGVFAVTMFGNVPLNDQLDKFDMANSTAQKIKEMRDTFENRWNFLNNIRTIFSVITIVLTVCACIWNKVD